MNSEELELSLRTEFESYLNDVLADMKQEFSQFQENFEAEIERHKTQLDEVIQNFSSRVIAERQLEESFKESVVEHLRLSRDEGARITAEAIAEAEEMELESASAATVSANFSEMRDAINEISVKTTQSAILKSLIHHAAQFTPRGAFFIIKNEHLVGWRVFGKEGNSDEQAVREVFFPVAASTVLGASVNTLSSAEGSFGDYADDSIYLNKLEFGHPDKMMAIPLVVRGRGVAVLYADNGTEGESVNVEALETLVRVASLTVEVIASAKSARAKREVEQKIAYSAETSSEVDTEELDHEEFEASESDVSAPVEEAPSYEQVIESDSFAVRQAFQSEPPAQAEYASSYDQPVETEEETEEFETAYAQEEEVEETPAWGQSVEFSSEYVESGSMETAAEGATQYSEPVEESSFPADDFSAPAVAEYEFESKESFDSSETEFEETSQKFEAPEFEAAENFSPVSEKGFGSFEISNGKAESFASEAAEKPVEVVTSPPIRTRFSERNVDLPIEVGEEERRLHNDARRFARLLVSEIKLYNEQKVKEGLEARDLYERLREAIDRSREMYDKRVQPPVAARFDYFHYEVVSNLAEGDETKLGESYPGATV